MSKPSIHFFAVLPKPMRRKSLNRWLLGFKGTGAAAIVGGGGGDHTICSMSLFRRMTTSLAEGLFVGLRQSMSPRRVRAS